MKGVKTSPVSSGKQKRPSAEASKTSCAVIIGLIVFFGMFALITWLALRPVHRPRYFMNSVQIKSFALNAADSSVSANFVYNVTARNDNHKMVFKYDWMTIDASYGGENFARSSIGGFKVGKTSSFTRTSEISVQNVLISPKTVTSLAAAIKNSTVPLRVYAKAKLNVVIGKYVSFPLSLDLDCKLVVAPPSSTVPGKVVSQACVLKRPPYKKPKKFKRLYHQ
ncbi:hypothetical protein KC19_4G114300 [Ceratodon purpureus]|uniref:Late embryogenesis abundant protein LEA-2 subgroup domain-containing protein n=1 Tax=Ceratodon purpureus TaxID=3225 RepID=A0A8T0IB24_CERPU|nr:hypothetical protein KC19_4G114300 [Ceratodon purpureus]